MPMPALPPVTTVTLPASSLAKVMAPAPFGHAVTIQKSSAAAIATNVRPALTKGGSQSGRRRRRTATAGNRPGGIGNE